MSRENMILRYNGMYLFCKYFVNIDNDTREDSSNDNSLPLPNSIIVGRMKT